MQRPQGWGTKSSDFCCLQAYSLPGEEEVGNDHDHGEKTKHPWSIKDTLGQHHKSFLRQSGQGVFSEVTLKLRSDWPKWHEHRAGASARALCSVCVIRNGWNPLATVPRAPAVGQTFLRCCWTGGSDVPSSQRLYPHNPQTSGEQLGHTVDHQPALTTSRILKRAS